MVNHFTWWVLQNSLLGFVPKCLDWRRRGFYCHQEPLPGCPGTQCPSLARTQSSDVRSPCHPGLRMAAWTLPHQIDRGGGWSQGHCPAGPTGQQPPTLNWKMGFLWWAGGCQLVQKSFFQSGLLNHICLHTHGYAPVHVSTLLIIVLETNLKHIDEVNRPWEFFK